VIGLKRLGLLLVVGALVSAVVVEAGAAAPVSSASKKCKKKHHKKKHKKCKKKKGGTKTPTPTGPTVIGGPLSISPSSWNFGSYPVGLVTGSQQFAITNTAADGTGPLSTSIGGANPGNFSISGDSCAGKALTGGGRCSLFVSCVSSGSLPATFTGILVVSANPGGTREAALTCSQF
jgi:hypothetical protein